jgi:hypothetical protein
LVGYGENNLENDKQKNFIILFLFILLLINFFWINKEIKNIFNDIFSLDQFVYIVIMIGILTLIISLKTIFKKREIGNIEKIFSNDDYTIIENNGNIIAIKGLEIQELKEYDQKEDALDKFQTFISTLVKNKVPCIYTLSIMPFGGIKSLISNEEVGSRIWLMTFGKSNKENKSIEEMERNFIIMESALQTAFPKIYIKKIEKEDLRNFFEVFLFKKKIRIKKDMLHIFLPFTSPYTFTRILPSINDNQKDVEQEKFQEQIYLGWSIESSFEKSKEYLNINNINRHIIIFGSTGTGKTTTTLSIALRLWEKGFPILILDWHNEYGKIAEKINGRIISLGKDGSYSINPFKPLFLENDIYTHIDMLCDIFSETFNFSAPQSYMFLKALVEEYKARGFLNKEVKKLEAPNLLAILERIQRMAPYSRFDYEIKMALERRLQPLTLGQLGEIFCGENIIKIDDIMQGFTVIELGYIKSYLSKRILLYLILKLIYDYCIHRGKIDKLIHVTVIEEAQNIVPMKKDFEIPSIGERLIFDVRKFGEGIILVAQLPSQISSNITKNVSTRIIHAIKGKNDITYSFGKSGIYEGEKILQSLREGEAIIDSIGKRNVKIVYIEPHELLEIK